MSKIYDKYLNLKEKDPNKLYLFRCGNFYIFLEKDAERINQYIVLKQTQFTKNIKKCGFPVNRKNEYLRVFQNHKLDIEVIENPLVSEDISEREQYVISYLKKINIDHLKPVDALLKLQELQEMLYEKRE